MIERRWWVAVSVCSAVFSAAPKCFAEEGEKARVRQSRAARASYLLSTPSALPKKERRILGLQLPAFLSFSVGGLAAGGAATTGILASGRYNDPRNCAVQCPDHRGHGLWAASGVLAGLAVASIGTGIVLLLTAPKPAAERTWVPDLRLRLSMQKAGASVAWSF
jgi:hypothetical protein